MTLLHVLIDKTLTVKKKHIDNLVRKTGYKLYTVRCIRKFPTVEKPKILGNAFIDKRLN